MQSGYGTGAESADAADLWVRDPRTGEYRMLLPGETAPAPEPAAPVPAAATTVPPGTAPRRAARRRERAARRSGPWIAGAVCFVLAVGGTGGYLLLHHSGNSTGASGRSGAAPGPSGSASCPAQPVATGPVPEPAVSGTFLQGSRATAVNVRVTVLNGTGTIGQAEAVLTWLQSSQEGFLRSSNGGPAPATAKATTLVYAPNHVDQARTLAAALGLPATALHGDGKTSDPIGRMVLTLGQDFHGIGKPFAAPSPAASAPPAGATTGCGSQ
ncbi:LytR C-terminal domain-containing protein [Streptacidiphilus sp. N1-12]|uniref:LytR C-terminal domain-containing protein n=2 Tax=Streptacidiphilus alkalitolerans TaxID=3342712 RepID=A0ABV6VLR6_9ACTN